MVSTKDIAVVNLDEGVKIKGKKGEIEDFSYRNLTNKVVIFSAPNEKAGKITISSMGAEAFESKIPLQEYPAKD